MRSEAVEGEVAAEIIGLYKRGTNVVTEKSINNSNHHQVTVCVAIASLKSYIQ